MNVYKLLGGLFGDRSCFRLSYRKECDQTYHNKYTVTYNMPYRLNHDISDVNHTWFFLMSFFISNQARSINFEKKRNLEEYIGEGGVTLVPFFDYM